MPTPPSDPWDDLISQVEASLDHADYPQGPMREAVLEGIRSALTRMEEPRPSLRLVELEPGERREDRPEDRSQGRPEGRSEGRPERERPALRLAHRRVVAPADPMDDLFRYRFGDLGPELYDLDDDDPVDGPGYDGPGGPGDLGPGDLDLTDPGLMFRRPSRERPLIEEGRIFLGAPASRQWIWRGSAARIYRIGCTLGAFGVRVDGEEAFTVSEGQSVDVEGARIEIGDPVPAGTEGVYACLSG